MTTTDKFIYFCVGIFYMNTIIYAYRCNFTHGTEGGENLFLHVENIQPKCCIDQHLFSVYH